MSPLFNPPYSPPQEEPDELPSARLRALSFANLNPTHFEEFVYDLMGELGFVNVDWRKGTPKDASPSDRGRDIVAQWVVEDVDGHQRFETWFVDAKHYDKGVPPEALQGLMTWAESERPDVALVACSGFLSNPAKDWVENYKKNRAPAFRIRHWERPDLAKMLDKHRDLISKHNIMEDEAVRTIAELKAAEKEFFDKVWYVRSLIREEKIASGERADPAADESEEFRTVVNERIEASRQAIRDAYGADTVGPWDDWEWGFVNGKLSALRWMLGDEWDFLDT